MTPFILMKRVGKTYHNTQDTAFPSFAHFSLQSSPEVALAFRPPHRVAAACLRPFTTIVKLQVRLSMVNRSPPTVKNYGAYVECAKETLKRGPW